MQLADPCGWGEFPGRHGIAIVTGAARGIDVWNAGQIREVLLSVINRGATSLIADMSTTI